jgi:hypothetical protein
MVLDPVLNNPSIKASMRQSEKLNIDWKIDGNTVTTAIFQV